MSNLEIPGAPGGGWTVLIGGGDFSLGETKDIDRFLLSKLPAGRRTIGFIPAASGSNDYPHHFAEYISKLDSSVEVKSIPVFRTRDARRSKNLESIRACGMVYVGGGVPNLLLAAIHESPAVDAFRDVLSGGGVVAAIGASASCFGMYAPDIRRAGATLPALNWIRGAAIIGAFEPDDDEPLRSAMAIPGVTLGIGIPRSTALAFAPDGSAIIVGSGRIGVVRRP